MKIYLLEECAEYEESYRLGIFSSIKLAKQYKKNYEKRKPNYLERITYEISEIEVIEK